MGYKTPTIAIIRFTAEDIITTSNNMIITSTESMITTATTSFIRVPERPKS